MLEIMACNQSGSLDNDIGVFVKLVYCKLYSHASKSIHWCVRIPIALAMQAFNLACNKSDHIDFDVFVFVRQFVYHIGPWQCVGLDNMFAGV